MAFWNRKKEQVAEEEPLPVVRDSDNWRAWEEAGRKLMEDNNSLDAIHYYVQAVDLFDGNQRDLERFLARVCADIMACAKRITQYNRAVPMHLMAEIDNEIAVKHPDIVPEKTLTDIVMDGCDGAIDIAEGPADVVMLGLTSLCCALGYVRYSCDMREDIIRCARASEICIRGSGISRGMKPVKGQLHPNQGVLILNTYSELAESIKGMEAVVISDMSDQQLDDLAEYRREHPVDLLDNLINALDGANRTVIGKKNLRKKNLDFWMNNVRIFAEVKSSRDE